MSSLSVYSPTAPAMLRACALMFLRNHSIGTAAP
jgi:hypothetical protein